MPASRAADRPRVQADAGGGDGEPARGATTRRSAAMTSWLPAPILCPLTVATTGPAASMTVCNMA